MKVNVKMRSLFCLLLALLLVLSMAACDGTDSAPDPDSEDTSASESGESSGEDSNGSSDPGTDPDGTPKKTPKEIFDAMAVKTVAHYEKNDDTVGWITIPGTVIDEVIVQAPDNDYYLRRNNLKGNAFDGCYFADFRANMAKRAALSKNMVIYGHSMDDNPQGARFSQLKKYLDVEFCKENSYIYFTTAESDNMLWQVFAVFYTDIKFEYHHPNPENNAEFLNLITEARKRSEMNYDIDVGVGDTILTLSTCTYLFNPANRSNYRFVVMAKLLPAGTQPASQVKVEPNPNPKRPT